ncbi:hypothetical protein AMTR_s00060p00138000 [Amborella trichopoda]|uniref:RING-type E3 ubiquitin transferase n=1 Tax=Amborella trichopoda TaxID=13333 RepID=W1NK29_AMBTC|nr:hypothetical protein AMTR_s00060p00138000 [Amborella trichopoda]
MVSFFWWIVGFYWVVAGGEALMHNAPRLYWLAVVFLAFDVLFAIFCVALACIIGIALCCCLPCIIAILYAVAGQEGASDADINILPRYRFSQAGSPEKPITGSGTMTALANATDERVISSDEAECCICLSPYEDGVEINALPCNHHFHSTCIVKWLRINATCPLWCLESSKPSKFAEFFWDGKFAPPLQICLDLDGYHNTSIVDHKLVDADSFYIL